MKVNFIFMSVYSKIKSCTLWKSTELSTPSQKDIEWYSVEVNFTRMSVSAKIKKLCSIKFNFIDIVLFYKGKERYSIEINFIGMSVSTKIKSSIRWKSSSMSVYSKIKSDNSWNSTSLACPSIFRYKAVFIRSQFYWHVRLLISKQLYFIEVKFIGIFRPY